jgi:hypothetical protein
MILLVLVVESPKSQSHPPIGHCWLDVFNLCCLEKLHPRLKLHGPASFAELHLQILKNWK